MSAGSIFGTDSDPDGYVVGGLAEPIYRLQNGVHLLAQAKGVHLWAKLLDGRPVDYRAFDEAGRELGIVKYYLPDDTAAEPKDGLLRPPPEEIPMPGGGWPLDRDGGTVCAYVCAATSDGGRICWLECR